MPASIIGEIQPWFTITETLSGAQTAGTSVDVSEIIAVAFDADVNLTIGSLAAAFPLAAGTPISIHPSTSEISVDVNAFMFAMGEE